MIDLSLSETRASHYNLPEYICISLDITQRDVAKNIESDTKVEIDTFVIRM